MTTELKRAVRRLLVREEGTYIVTMDQQGVSIRRKGMPRRTARHIDWTDVWSDLRPRQVEGDTNA